MHAQRVAKPKLFGVYQQWRGISMWQRRWRASARIRRHHGSIIIKAAKIMAASEKMAAKIAVKYHISGGAGKHRGMRVCMAQHV